MNITLCFCKPKYLHRNCTNVNLCGNCTNQLAGWSVIRGRSTPSKLCTRLKYVFLQFSQADTFELIQNSLCFLLCETFRLTIYLPPLDASFQWSCWTKIRSTYSLCTQGRKWVYNNSGIFKVEIWVHLQLDGSGLLYAVESGFSCVADHLLLDLFCANLRYKTIICLCRYDKVVINLFDRGNAQVFVLV
jgi:hypothetical protein